MANGIKIGNLDINSFKVGSADCKVYLGDTLLYSGGTQPTFEGKWKAIHNDSSVSSADCDASSAITRDEIYESENEEIVSVEIGWCVTELGSGSFDSFHALTSITIPNSVTSIGDFAFEFCDGLTSIDIPNGVTTIGQQAFFYCTSLTSITVNATTPPTLGRNAFYYTNDCPIYVPSQSLNAYLSAWSEYANRIQAIPNN